MPDEPVIDGEVVVPLDSSGEPSFNSLQNCAYHAGLLRLRRDNPRLQNVNQPLTVRRELLRDHVPDSLILLLAPGRRAPCGILRTQQSSYHTKRKSTLEGSNLE